MTSTDRTRRRLLIVEDDPEVLGGYEAVLAHPDISVDRAANGIEALARARAFLPHVMLLDVTLPGMDGFEIFRILRKDPDLRLIRVIFVSAHSAPGALAMAKDLGAWAWMRKPFGEEKLRKRVLEALEMVDEPGRPARRTPPQPIPSPSREEAPAKARAAAAAARSEAEPPAPRAEPPLFVGAERLFILVISPLRYAAGVRRRVESVGARAVVASCFEDVIAFGRSPLVLACLVVEPVGDMTFPAFVEALGARGVSAPIIHLTSGPAQHPRATPLPRLFTSVELREVLARIDGRADSPGERRAAKVDAGAETRASPAPYLGF
jgi:CheY-like chemotaxis protein